MARGKMQGFVEQGGHTVLTDGRVSTDKVQQSFPLATVEVFNAGTAVQATIFSDEAGTPKANPFIADSTGFWFFWADAGRYDVEFSGAGIPTPFTIFSLETIIAQGTALLDPGANGIVVRTALNTTVARTLQGTASAIIITFPDGVAGNPVLNLDANLAFTGKTITGGTFVTPSIGNFSAAVHTHENAVGGGQLNATNVFSAGTVPVARLPIMVGASGVANGVAGLVPQPVIGDESRFLRGDGTWQTAGGGGGSPGGANTTIQYNNAGVFGGVSGATSDGTNITFGSGNLRATRPRITTSIDDTNGNEVIGLVSVGSAVNEVSIANAGTGVGPTISVTGGDTDTDLNIAAKGTGIISSVSNFRISNNAPQITLVDVNDSKTVRISLSGTNWSFINDTLGSTPINIDTTSNLVTFAGNVTIENTSPTILFSDVGQNDANIVVNTNIMTIGRIAQSDLAIDLATGVATFGQIPVGPAANPTTANQLVRKQYVDDNTFWTANFFIADPATFPLSSFNLVQKAFIPADGIPAGRRWRATRASLIWSTGSESGSFTVLIRSHPVNDQTSQTTLATFDIDTEDIGVGVEIDIDDVVFTSDTYVFCILSARSSPLQKDVSITLIGDKLGT